MTKQILFLLFSVSLFSGCSSTNAPEIHALCLRDDIGNYIIKWETDPHTDGIIKMYVSDDPENVSTSNAAVTANMDNGVATFITNDNITRKYFLLSFNDKYTQTVGSRSVTMDSIQNVRDMGGYFYNHNTKMTRWGKIFRSGGLNAISSRDSFRLNNLGIKTIIDLRSEDEAAIAPIKYGKAKIISIPVPVRNINTVISRITEGTMRKGDAQLFMQDTYLHYVDQDSEQFGRALKVFLDQDNYPILISCSMGKDRTGFLSAMLMSAVGIPEETIIHDYLTSNDYINITQLAYKARDLSTDSQESITVLLTANESLMDLVFRQIRKKYGSTDKFLSKGLHLTEKERDTLKDIVLY